MGKTLILVILLLAGCASTASPDNPRQIWCDHNQPRRDATATTPRPEIDRINTHNRLGTAWCGWRP